MFLLQEIPNSPSSHLIHPATSKKTTADNLKGIMAICAWWAWEILQYLSFTFDENSKGFCVGRDWQVVFVVKLRQQCVGGRRFCLIQCWEMGGDLILPSISCFSLFSGKHLPERTTKSLWEQQSAGQSWSASKDNVQSTSRMVFCAWKPRKREVWRQQDLHCHG